MKIDELVHLLPNVYKNVLFTKELHKQGFSVRPALLASSYRYVTTYGTVEFISYDYEVDPDCYTLSISIYSEEEDSGREIKNISYDTDGQFSLEYCDDSIEEFYLEDVNRLCDDDFVFQQSTLTPLGNTNGKSWETCLYYMQAICTAFKGV